MDFAFGFLGGFLFTVTLIIVYFVEIYNKWGE